MKPSIFIPTLYLASGLPYTIVNAMSIVFFKNMHADNEFIAQFTSLLQIPWVIKAFWAPTVDLYGTRRQWIVVSQIVLGALAICLAAVAQVPDPINVVVDTSHWNRDVDFAKLANAGIIGVIQKVSQGQTGVDFTYNTNKPKALAAGGKRNITPS